MASAETLTTLRDRLENFLIDTTNAVFPADTLTEGIRMALNEYSAFRPLRKIGTVTPSDGAQETSLSALTGIIGVERVWFPYDSAKPPLVKPPELVFDVYWDAGVPSLYLWSATGDGTNKARIFYFIPHTLNGLDSASATTFPQHHESLLLHGAAGHACFSRSIDLSETDARQTTTTPNLLVTGSRFLREFRFQLRGGG